MANSQAHSAARQDNLASGADRARRAFLSRDFWVKASFILPGLLYLFCLSAYPIFYNGLMSLQHFTVASFLNGAAPFVGLANYFDLFRDFPVRPGVLAHDDLQRAVDRRANGRRHGAGAVFLATVSA